MPDEYDDDLTGQEFPPLEDDAVFEEPDLEDAPVLDEPGLEDQSELWYNTVPDSGEEPDQSSAPDPAWETQPGERAPFETPEQDPPAFVAPESEGSLFLPEDDPLLAPPPVQPPVPMPVRKPKYVPQRLRHLVSEPKHSVHKDFSGRNPGRG